MAVWRDYCLLAMLMVRDMDCPLLWHTTQITADLFPPDIVVEMVSFWRCSIREETDGGLPRCTVQKAV